MFDHLTVRGYAYTSVRWSPMLPAAVPVNPDGTCSVQKQFWAGGVIEALVPPAGKVKETWSYQIKLDATHAAQDEARTQVADEDSQEPDDAEILGLARIRRVCVETEEVASDECRVALEGLDDGAQVLDRLTGAVLTWHAELHGTGPRNQRAA